MKKTSILLAGALLASMLSCSSPSMAQVQAFNELPLISITATLSPVSVSARLNKAFGRVFQSATNQRWYEVEKNFLVKFNMNGRENRALFTSKGALVYHVEYGSESFLPHDVRQLVKSKYYDQTISRVLKIEQDKRTIWLIHLEDANDHIRARVEDMELEETQRLHKDK